MIDNDITDLRKDWDYKNNDDTLILLERIDKLCMECGRIFQALKDVQECLRNGENNKALTIINEALELKIYNNRSQEVDYEMSSLQV